MIRNWAKFKSWLPALFDGEFQWDFLAPCFAGTKIEPMDFDCVIERGGHVLIFETKEDDKKIPTGQKIALTTMWKKGCTVIHVAGKTPETISAYCVYSGTDKDKSGMVGDRSLVPGDSFDVVFIVRQWFCWASRLPVPDRETWDRELFVWDYDRNLGKLPCPSKP